MRSDYILSILLFFPLLVIQTTLGPLISIHGVAPDLIIILLVYYSMRTGQVYGTVLGFIYGLFIDLITGTLLGSTMISKTIAGFIAGYFSGETKRDNYIKSYVFVLIVLLCSVADLIISSLFSTIDLNTNILMLFFNQGILPGIYTAILSIFVVIFYPNRIIK